MYTHTALVRMQALSSVSFIEQLFISAAAAVETALSTGNYTALLMLHDHTSNQVSHATTTTTFLSSRIPYLLAVCNLVQ
jgi:hypothetical protein